MIDKENIKGIIFDYGGTIDSNGLHWAEVIRRAYTDNQVFLNPDKFLDAYVHGERTLGKNRIITPEHTFRDMMRHKIAIQMKWLQENSCITRNNDELSSAIADDCYDFARRTIAEAHALLEALAQKYPLALVSNFYGNLNAVLKDFGLDGIFNAVVESAVVGVRKPDPQIFSVGAEALHLPTENVVVVGDSYDKDIVPATQVGFQTVWLRKIGWNEYRGDETADAIIGDFSEIGGLLL